MKTTLSQTGSLFPSTILHRRSPLLPRNRPRLIGAVLQARAPNPIELMGGSVTFVSNRCQPNGTLAGPIDPPHAAADRHHNGNRPNYLIGHYILPRPAPL